MQYRENKKLSFSSGKILNYKDNLLIHRAVICSDSSGSPLIRRNYYFNYVIGIHFGKMKEGEQRNLDTPFDDIIKNIKIKLKYYNSIFANITINKDNYKAKIINSFENSLKEGLV